jgi:hypothetical protein
VYRIEGPLQEVPLRALRPTQMTVGFKEVQAKRKQWAKLGHGKRKAAMAEVLFPVVAGPKGVYFILDHHHTAVALMREGARKVQIGVVRDLSGLNRSAFWIYLDHESWVHPYDRKGRRRTFREIPASFAGLRDDPYRSLAGAVQDAGGFAKSDTPFLEFLWTNYFRTSIPAGLVKSHYHKAVRRAAALAHTQEAQHLPGWTGHRKP